MRIAASEGSPNMRFLVPDLSPMDRPELRSVVPWVVFVGESPHVQEVEPETLRERRPLCGAAGRQWWQLLSEVAEGAPDSDVSRDRLLVFCQEQGIAVVNSVQYPLDPKIVAAYPEADPVANLGFSKAAGKSGYKRLRDSPAVQGAIASLRARLSHPSLRGAEVWCLGNDSVWFTTRALAGTGREVSGKIPHPSAWWRRGGFYGRVAREKLGHLFHQQERLKLRHG